MIDDWLVGLVVLLMRTRERSARIVMSDTQGQLDRRRIYLKPLSAIKSPKFVLVPGPTSQVISSWYCATQSLTYPIIIIIIIIIIECLTW